jgi:hypothetical protein
VFANSSYDDKVDLWTTGIMAYQLFNYREGEEELPFPFEGGRELRARIVKRGGIDYQEYMEYTSKIGPFE